MLYTVIKPNSYQDSINLMLITSDISQIDGVNKVQVMMGTQANKDIFNEAGLLTEEAENAAPSDMMIVMDVENENVKNSVLKTIEKSLADLSIDKTSDSNQMSVKNWNQALKEAPEANIALISVPGEYAAVEIENALYNGMHAFVFSDNVSIQDEVRLKKIAHEKGLLVMGPDCGTGIISGVPMAFTNVVKEGNISIVGASGTGIQEVSTIIEKLGGGVTHAIGTGGRDLSEAVDATTMKDILAGLAKHEPTKVIVVISKPPAPKVRDEVVGLLREINKPVVAIFLGEKPKNHEEGLYLAHTLEETAQIAVDLAKDKPIKANYTSSAPLINADPDISDKKIIGLYSGGTLAYETGMLISEALQLDGIIKDDGYVLKSHGYEVIDLGDDRYTQGRPHPMIDPEIRIKKIMEYSQNPEVGVILLDDVLGYGTHNDMASALIPSVKEAKKFAQLENRKLYFVATVVGTVNDPQYLIAQQSALEDAGVIVCKSNAEAVRYALNLVGKEVQEENKEVLSVKLTSVKNYLSEPSNAVMNLLYTKPNVINIGLRSFYDPILNHGGKAIQFDWKPIAGGNKQLIKILTQLNHLEQIDLENQKVIEEMKNGAPYLIDIVPAKSVIGELNHKVLLHAGPPISYKEMTSPMQGSCIGAVLFEGWANDEDSARELLESGEIEFIPCHHVRAVGPMGGITSGNMPVMVIENRLKNNQAFCTMNEGIGKVLRFGAYSQEVIDRLIWMKDVLGPVLGQAVRSTHEGININVIMAKAITMGDEFHQRNIAASLVFLKEVAPKIISLDISDETKRQVIQFLADTDQFFLNIMMATGKSIVDAARMIQEGTIVTTMTRNGKNFGIRISGMGDEWFEAPVNTPQGLFFTGFSQEDANPDIGDSAIAETVGFGGMAMIAAPGVTRFVGAGGFQDALDISNEMADICVTHNPNFSIPTWDFKGSVLGVDIRKVVETGITPIINTGIAGKVAGIGQVGAGTVNAPLECFEKALVAYAKKLGIDTE